MSQRTSLVRTVKIDDSYYLHIIDLDDDHIRVYDEESDKLILTYTSNGEAKLPSGEMLGRFHMEGGYHTGIWQFEFAEKFGGSVVNGFRCVLPQGLLDTEVLVTKEFLKSNRNIAQSGKSGCLTSSRP